MVKKVLGLTAVLGNRESNPVTVYNSPVRFAVGRMGKGGVWVESQT